MCAQRRTIGGPAQLSTAICTSSGPLLHAHSELQVRRHHAKAKLLSPVHPCSTHLVRQAAQNTPSPSVRHRAAPVWQEAAEGGSGGSGPSSTCIHTRVLSAKAQGTLLRDPRAQGQRPPLPVAQSGALACVLSCACAACLPHACMPNRHQRLHAHTHDLPGWLASAAASNSSSAQDGQVPIIIADRVKVTAAAACCRMAVVMLSCMHWDVATARDRRHRTLARVSLQCSAVLWAVVDGHTATEPLLMLLMCRPHADLCCATRLKKLC